MDAQLSWLPYTLYLYLDFHLFLKAKRTEKGNLLRPASLSYCTFSPPDQVKLKRWSLMQIGTGCCSLQNNDPVYLQNLTIHVRCSHRIYGSDRNVDLLRFTKSPVRLACNLTRIIHLKENVFFGRATVSGRRRGRTWCGCVRGPMWPPTGACTT